MNRCVACGAPGPLRRQTRLTTFKYKSQVLTYDQPGLWCDVCGEVFLNKTDKDATDPLIKAFQEKVDQ